MILPPPLQERTYPKLLCVLVTLRVLDALHRENEVVG